MKIIVGLGNIGDEYKATRHNAGFMALDFFMELPEIEKLSESEKFKARVIDARALGLASDRILIVYPHTYMNDSGIAVREILDFYKLGLEDLLVLHDDVDLPLGTVRFTENSGSAGHNGVKSIIDELENQEFARIRIGVESRQEDSQLPTEDFVLQKFSNEELVELPFDLVSEKIFEWLDK